MAVKLIPCRNRETGATAEIPETALPHMTSWEPIESGTEKDTAEAAAADITSDPDVPSPDDPKTPARKSKAAKATTTSKED